MKKQTIWRKTKRNFAKKKNKNIALRIFRFLRIPLIILFFFSLILYIPFPSLIFGEIYNSETEEIKRDITIYTKELLEEKYFGVTRAKRSFLNLTSISNDIVERFSYLKSVEIDRSFLAINLTLKSRDVFATHCIKNECVLIDTSGFVFSNTTITPNIKLLISEKIAPGNYVLDKTVKNRKKIFSMLVKTIEHLEGGGFFVDFIELHRDNSSAVLHIANEPFELWIDMGIQQNKQKQSIRIIFDEVFTTKLKRSKIKFFDIRNPDSLEYLFSDSQKIKTVSTEN